MFCFHVNSDSYTRSLVEVVLPYTSSVVLAMTTELNIVWLSFGASFGTYPLILVDGPIFRTSAANSLVTINSALLWPHMQEPDKDW